MSNLIDAANLSYSFESARVNGAFDYNIIEKTNEIIQLKGKSIPENLEYLEDMHDKETGTGGVAFRDKNTGEIIIAFPGTNPEGDYIMDMLTDLKGVILGDESHYKPAYDFHS